MRGSKTFRKKFEEKKNVTEQQLMKRTWREDNLIQYIEEEVSFKEIKWEVEVEIEKVSKEEKFHLQGQIEMTF